MGRHEFLDNLIAGIGSLYGESLKFFSNGMESPSVGELIGKVDLSVPAVDREGEYEVSATMDGQSIETRFSVIEWAGDNAPVLIFHHGSGDQPYHSRIRKILGSNPVGCTVIATDSPYNRTRKEYYQAVSSLKSFAEIFAVSTVLIERIIERLKARLSDGSPCSARKIVVSGISLGGWIANLHHAFFDTADEYRPIFAGAAPDALFLDSSYSRLLTNRTPEKRNNITLALNFEHQFSRRPTDRVYPLLARYDQYVVYDRQKGVYNPESIEVMEKGHVTGGAANTELKNFLLRGIPGA